MDITELVAVVMTMSIPLSAILGAYYIKLKKIKAQGALSNKDMERIQHVLQENKELKERVNNLETIVTEIDSQLRQLPESGTRDY